MLKNLLRNSSFPSTRGLRSIPSLSQFRRLKHLWINNNKVMRYSFKEQNNASILPDYHFVFFSNIKYYIIVKLINSF